jgi:hypothetical protein
MPNREQIFDCVRQGELSPTMAEAWLDSMGYGSVPTLTDLRSLDPMLEREWTLPMAAAWFIWRSPIAVRDQWDRYRLLWLANSDIKQLTPLLGVSLYYLFLGADLSRFQPSTPLRSQRRASKRIPKVNISDTLPAKRLLDALVSRRLNVTGSIVETLERSPVAPQYLDAYFTHLMRKNKSLAPSSKDTAYRESGTPPRPQYTELRVLRDEVLSTDEFYSQEEFDHVSWTTDRVLGWIAERNSRRLRSLSPIKHPSRSKTGPGPIYTFDFVDTNPDKALLAALRQDQISADVAGPAGSWLKTLTPQYWRRQTLLNAPMLDFQRELVLRLWPPLSERNGMFDRTAASRVDEYLEPSMRTFDKMTATHKLIITVMRHLWPNKEWPPNQKHRRKAMIDEWVKKRNLGEDVPVEKTIKTAIEKFDALEPKVAWT